MIPMVIKDRNAVLGAGQPEYHPLHIKREIVDNHMEMSSLWEPTPEELRVLNAGGAVKLTILGNGHPPVKMSVQRAPDVRDI